MNVPQREGVSPIIATLLLIAIAVAAGVIVYVFVNGLAGNLTKPGGNQVTDQISLDSYAFQTSPPNFVTLYLHNTGTGNIVISSVYFNGAPSSSFYGSCGAVASGAFTFVGTTFTVGTAPITVTVGTSSSTTTMTIASTGSNGPITTSETGTSTAVLTPESQCTLNIFDIQNTSPGSSYPIRLVTLDGGETTFNIIAGSSG